MRTTARLVTATVAGTVLGLVLAACTAAKDGTPTAATATGGSTAATSPGSTAASTSPTTTAPPAPSSTSGAPSGSTSPSPPSSVTAPRSARGFLARPALAAAAAAGAGRALRIVNSYDYRHLDRSYAQGLGFAAGPFRASYRRVFQQEVRPNATRLHTVQRVTVIASALQSLDRSGTVAHVLLAGHLVNQRRGHTPDSEPITAAVTVRRAGARWQITQQSTRLPDLGPPAGTPGLARAVAAARTELARILTHTRAQFDTGYARALAGATGNLRRQLAATEGGTKRALEQGHFDTTGTARAAGVVLAVGLTVVVLVDATSRRVGATASADAPQQLTMTMTLVDGAWLASDVRSIA